MLQCCFCVLETSLPLTWLDSFNSQSYEKSNLVTFLPLEIRTATLIIKTLLILLIFQKFRIVFMHSSSNNCKDTNNNSYKIANHILKHFMSEFFSQMQNKLKIKSMPKNIFL